MLGEGEHSDNVKIMDDVAGGAATSLGIKEKVRKVWQSVIGLIK